MMTFSTTGVTAATAWPTTATPNAMTTLRRWASRNGDSRRIHPPLPTGRGSSTARSIAGAGASVTAASSPRPSWWLEYLTNLSTGRPRGR